MRSRIRDISALCRQMRRSTKVTLGWEPAIRRKPFLSERPPRTVGVGAALAPRKSGDPARHRHDNRGPRGTEENHWPIRLMSLIFEQMINGCRDRNSDGGPPMHKVVAKITGVLHRARGASAGFCRKQADRDLAQLQVRSGERVTDSLEFEMFQRLLSERRNFIICCD
jgi:hypothetical protein